MRRLAMLLSLCAASCTGGGGGGGGGGSFSDNGGSGTGTLKVTMTVSADRVPGDVIDDIVANLSLSDSVNAAVPGATVTLTTPGGDLSMTETTPGLGFYSLPAGTHLYPNEGFRLNITRDTDTVENVSIAAPGLTQVTEPVNQDTIALNTDAPITWTGRGATDHRVEFLIGASLYDTGWVAGDTGTETIPAAFLQTSGVGSLTVRRRKTMSIPTTTARPGSVWTINLRDDIAPIAVN